LWFLGILGLDGIIACYTPKQFITIALMFIEKEMIVRINLLIMAIVSLIKFGGPVFTSLSLVFFFV